MLGNLTGWHFLIILIVILLLFGAPKLPGLAKSLGQSMHIFKREVKSLGDEDEKPADSATVAEAESTSPESQRKSQ